MKKIITTILPFLFIQALSAQSKKPAMPSAGGLLFPSKYAIILYGKKVSDTSGKNQLMASHWQNVGGGTFTWKQLIQEEGAYEVALSYATDKSGTAAKLSANRDNMVTANLAVTSGYYPQKKEWYQVNCERRQVPGILQLQKGENTVSLQITTADATDETIIYAVELLPVKQKKEIEKERIASTKLRSNTDWLAKIPYGVMFHWTSQSAPKNGNMLPYKDAVNAFDVTAFTDMVVKTGAGYVILTTNHAEPYFPAPLKEWEKVYPGHTTQRDLIKEIADKLEQHNIKLFLYMATHIYAKYDSVDDDVFRKLNYSLVGEVGERYGKKVAGYWFDGWYQCYEKHPDFDFGQFYKICKTGNADRLVCLNSWVYPIVTLWQDYWAGEVYIPGNPPVSQIIENGPGRGLQTQHLIVMETEDWLHSTAGTKIPPPHLTSSELTGFIARSKGKGPVTVNMQIYQDGSVGEEALAVMETVKKETR